MGVGVFHKDGCDKRLLTSCEPSNLRHKEIADTNLFRYIIFMADEEVRKKSPSKKLLLFAAPLVVIIIAGGLFYKFKAPHDPIPKSISSQAAFTLYYPKALPQHWSLDKSSFYANSNDQVVGYLLRGPHANLNITIQPVPRNFNFTSFYNQRLSGTVQFLTPLGQGAIGKANNQLVGSLVTTSAWVLASPSSSTGVAQTDIQFILSHLQPASS